MDPDAERKLDQIHNILIAQSGCLVQMNAVLLSMRVQLNRIEPSGPPEWRHELNSQTDELYRRLGEMLEQLKGFDRS